MRGTRYQIILIALSLLTVALFSYFFYVELFPEYRIYQNDYIALEQFRSTYSGQPPPPFSRGIKQIVIPRKDGGPVEIDRCTSCHVALKLEHFSPTLLAYDINGNLIVDADGIPEKEPNPDYIWSKLDSAIDALKAAGDDAQADAYAALKSASVEGHTYDVTKVLRMHPLIGKETRPFEFHPIDEYGCTSCHSGNGRGLTTMRAHGPVFDEDYAHAFMGPVPQFLEDDPHAPDFARAYNHKPDHALLFQTTPLLVGGVIEAKCMQCHQNSNSIFHALAATTLSAAETRQEQAESVIDGYYAAVDALAALFSLSEGIATNGEEATIARLDTQARDLTLSEEARRQVEAQATFLRKKSGTIDGEIERLIGSDSKALAAELKGLSLKEKKVRINAYVNANRTSGNGQLFALANAIEMESQIVDQLEAIKSRATSGSSLVDLGSQIDLLTHTYQRGEELFMSQACYACHRITGLSRGGIGPELTYEGNSYPWFVKESIVWPQADLPTSTMPNYHLDHEELEALTTFLLAQTGQRRVDSESGYKKAVLEWEGGKKRSWEQPVPPAQIHHLEYGMTLFATEGCAACHRLKGFESNVGLVDADKGDDAENWFRTLFPEEQRGSELVATVEAHRDAIDRRIVDGVREGALLERLEAANPGLLTSFYPQFKFALRAQNDASEEVKRDWQARIRRLLMIYIEQYGLGRLIGPRPNWSGIYRSDQWLMEHFLAPTRYAPRSIMPVFPFDKSKFYALTFMLDQLAIRNRDSLRQLWEPRGFNPEVAYERLCAQCHGDFLQGNGPVADWIYPIPKNLRNADFLRHLTREKVYESIVHGVKGTPMPPWGEADKSGSNGIPVITKGETKLLVDWLFSQIPGGAVIRDSDEIPKWQYTPRDVIEELQREGSELKGDELSLLPDGSQYQAALSPSPDVSQYFDVVPHPVGATEERGYYIKQRYYSADNLADGEAFFKLHCAVCHGNDADGAGNRSVAMEDAKPRMLTNLDWLDTRDDLRLLRSIKYGISGTSMAAWGDQTSSLQRMQLVMYIRSISGNAKLRDALSKALYDAFNRAEIAVKNVRIEDGAALARLQEELRATQEARWNLQNQARSDPNRTADAVSSYEKSLLIEQQIRNHHAADALLEQLQQLILQERQRYEEFGTTFIQQSNRHLPTDLLFAFINAAGEQLSYNDSTLSYNSNNADDYKKLGQQLIGAIEEHITTLKEKIEQQRGKIRSTLHDEELRLLNNALQSAERLHDELTALLAQTARSHQQQAQLVEQYTLSRQQLSTGDAS